MRKIIFGFALCFTFLCACTNQLSPDAMPLPESQSITFNGINEKSDNGEIDIASVPVSNKKLAVSTEEKSVIYNGDIKFISDVFAADYNYLYLYQSSNHGEQGLYRMEIGGSELVKLDYDIPDEMEINQLICDIEGKIHVILKDKPEIVNDKNADRRLMIDILIDGIMERELDFTDAMKNSHLPWIFTVDKDGNYYGRPYSGHELLVFDKQGNTIHLIDYKALGYDEMLSCGRGKDGRVYAILLIDETAKIGVVDIVSGDIIEFDTSILPNGEVWHRFIGPGTDTELLIYSRENGLFACDPQSGLWERRTVPEPPEENFKMTFLRYFLPDGRFLRIELVVDEYGNREKVTFNYLAAGR